VRTATNVVNRKRDRGSAATATAHAGDATITGSRGWPSHCLDADRLTSINCCADLGRTSMRSFDQVLAVNSI
jgi:hypothetical protein